MGRTRARRFLPVAIGLAAVILLYVCVSTASGPFTGGQATDVASFPRAARRALAHGQVAEAESLAKARPAGDPAAAAVLAEIANLQGHSDEALRLLESVAGRDDGGPAALELGLLHQQVGHSEIATKLLTTVYRRGSDGSDAESLFRAARAAQALGRARDAHTLYRAALAAGTDPAIETAWGGLFLQTYNGADALKSFEQAIKADAEWAPAHVGYARAVSEENPPAAATAANRALDINPRLADAHLVLAELDLDNTKYDDARSRIDKVLAINPSHLAARSLLAAISYVRDDRPAYEAEVKRILAINPAYSEVYRITGHLAAANYRFDEALALTRQAVALDPANGRAYGDLGLHLMRTGDEPEARRALDQAFKIDPFDKVTYNLLTLLDKLDKFDVVRDGDLIFKFQPDETAVLREYAIPLAHDALKALSAKYEFTPKGPILIEVFPVHDDFAVRNLGLPGLIGALGACFGRVVTVDSPRARSPGTFSWQATLWHELTHVITLQMSSQRIPRWLTEGISVYEEARARPEWGRDMEVPFAIALEHDKVLKLKDLNSGFTRPDTIALAYFEASLVVEHIVATKGQAALNALVRSYAQGAEGEAAVTKALGVSFDQLQASFDKAVDARFGGVRAALADTKSAAPSSDVAALKAAAEAQPGSYRAQLALGAALAAQKDRAAFDALEKAAALVPVAIGEESPHAIMGRLAEDLGDPARAIKEYRALLAQDHTTIEPARRLAALAEKTSDQQALAIAHDRVVSIDPFDAQGHTGLGRIALTRKDAATATREFKVALAIGPSDRAAAHCDLGESYLLAGKTTDAKREALAALEIAPSFERAQDLLLKSIEGKGQPEVRR